MIKELLGIVNEDVYRNLMSKWNEAKKELTPYFREDAGRVEIDNKTTITYTIDDIRTTINDTMMKYLVKNKELSMEHYDEMRQIFYYLYQNYKVEEIINNMTKEGVKMSKVIRK